MQTINSTVTTAEKDAVDVFAGIKNVFGMIKTGVESGGRVAASDATKSAVASLVEGAENLVTGDGGAAAKAIEGFIADVEAKHWTNAPHDIVACLKTGFAVLSKVGVSVPVATAFIAALPEIPAIG